MHAISDVQPYCALGNMSSDPSNLWQRLSRIFETPRRLLFESPAAYGQ